MHIYIMDKSFKKQEQSGRGSSGCLFTALSLIPVLFVSVGKMSITQHEGSGRATMGAALEFNPGRG